MSKAAARPLLNGAIFLAAVALGCAVLGWLAPFPEVPGIVEKWRYFLPRKDGYDTLFLGSSRFHHQIIPARFDAAAGTRSFNFGYDALWLPESSHLLRRLLALRPARLRWVVLDMMDLDSRLEDLNRSTLRTAYWHDWRHTLLVLRDIAASPRKPDEKFALQSEHAAIALRQALNLGRGADLVSRWLDHSRAKKKRKREWEDHEGWAAGLEKKIEGEQLELLTRMTLELRTKGIAPVPIGPVFREALAGMVAAVRRAGAEPVFVIAPTVNPRENYAEAPDGAAILRFNDPARHPSLFAPDRHYDAWHLNEKGAEEFTDALAAEFAQWKKGRP